MNSNYTIKNVIKYGVGGRIKKILFKVYEYFLPNIKIDKSLLDSNIKNYNLNETTAKLKDGYDKINFKREENKEYFNRILTWVGADKFLPDNPLFVYPPNIAVIDFFLKNIKKEDLILEYGCGLGNLIIYLNKLGYKNISGYDNFSQIKQETIEKFLDDFNLKQVLVSRESALKSRNRVAICICYFWNKLGDDILGKEINNQDLEYILVDYYYAPRHIKNFKIEGVYKDLLIVFKRKHG